MCACARPMLKVNVGSLLYQFFLVTFLCHVLIIFLCSPTLSRSSSHPSPPSFIFFSLLFKTKTISLLPNENQTKTQEDPKYQNTKPNKPKGHKRKNTESVLCWLTPGHKTCLKVWLIYPMVLHRKKLISFCQQVSIAKSILVRGGILYPFLLPAGILSYLKLYRSYVYCHSLCAFIHMCTSPVVSRRCCFLSVNYYILLFLLHSYLSLQGWDLMKTSYLGLSAPNFSLSAHCPSWFSVLIILIWKKQLFWRGLNDALFCGYSNMLLRVILWLCSFSRNSSMLSPRPVTYLVPGSWLLQQCQVWVLSKMVQAAGHGAARLWSQY